MMKKTQFGRTLSILLAVLVIGALLFAGCADGGTASSAVSSPPSSTTLASTTPATPGAETEEMENVTPDAAVSDSMSASVLGSSVQTLRGTIVDAAMNQFLIETDDGTSLVIPHMDADLSKLTDTGPGNVVIVSYTGAIDGTDTSGITVLSIEDA